MSDLVVIAFPTEAAAQDRAGDAVIAVKQSNGGVKLNQLFHPTAAGAATGAFWGTLIGLIFLMPPWQAPRSAPPAERSAGR